MNFWIRTLEDLCPRPLAAQGGHDEADTAKAWKPLRFRDHPPRAAPANALDDARQFLPRRRSRPHANTAHGRRRRRTAASNSRSARGRNAPPGCHAASRRCCRRGLLWRWGLKEEVDHKFIHRLRVGDGLLVPVRLRLARPVNPVQGDWSAGGPGRAPKPSPVRFPTASKLLSRSSSWSLRSSYPNMRPNSRWATNRCTGCSTRRRLP